MTKNDLKDATIQTNLCKISVHSLQSFFSILSQSHVSTDMFSTYFLETCKYIKILIFILSLKFSSPLTPLLAKTIPNHVCL